MHNYPGHVSVAHDDIYAHANTRSAIVDVTSANFAELRKREDERQLSCGQYSATCQNSAIFSQAFCPMKNILASSTAAGDLIIHVGLNPYGRRGATFKNDKVSVSNLPPKNRKMLEIKVKKLNVLISQNHFC